MLVSCRASDCEALKPDDSLLAMIMIMMIITIVIMIMMNIINIMVVKHLSPITDNSRLIEVYWWFGASPYRLSRLCLPSNTIV